MLGQQGFIVRRLEAPDVPAVLDIIGDCRREYGLESGTRPVLGPSDYDLLEAYRNRRSAYFVAIVDGGVAGGAGIARLPGADGATCELQRMYLRPASRRQGIGRALLQQCLQAARRLAYQHCYAETTSGMTSAITLYERHGFQRLPSPMGAARGHGDCWLQLWLQPQAGGHIGI